MTSYVELRRCGRWQEGPRCRSAKGAVERRPLQAMITSTLSTLMPLALSQRDKFQRSLVDAAIDRWLGNY
ncbi:hypothetical protein WK23_07030 [Burkholderia vietnamiensis]|nr:hypothetical protein WK23_07030 [Burkholderia vietnamiensis]